MKMVKTAAAKVMDYGSVLEAGINYMSSYNKFRQRWSHKDKNVFFSELPLVGKYDWTYFERDEAVIKGMAALLGIETTDIMLMVRAFNKWVERTDAKSNATERLFRYYLGK